MGSFLSEEAVWKNFDMTKWQFKASWKKSFTLSVITGHKGFVSFGDHCIFSAYFESKEDDIVVAFLPFGFLSMFLFIILNKISCFCLVT